jgi:hypothetical protein
MAALVAKPILRISELMHFGDVTLVPAAITGRSESELASSMGARALIGATPLTGAEALNLLDGCFRMSPLAARLLRSTPSCAADA